ncbi:MAG: Lactose transport system permease protein LacF [Phycisphaerales bacterium]|nr:Lactose transport system permease protein LacF [Phycisphaerales bacterium]MCK6475681.1 sugar ABC transporter permease [Phycisphaerales bacterium]
MSRSSAPPVVAPTGVSARRRSQGSLQVGREVGVLRGLLWASPWLVGFIAFMAVPVGMSLYYSFTDYNLVQRPVFIGLENYERMITDDLFWKAVGNTVLYAAMSIPLCTVAALVIASLLNKPIMGVSIYRAAVFLPTLVPAVASAMVWLWLYNGDLGLINRILRPMLEPLGVTPPNWIGLRGSGDKFWAMPALVFMSVWSVGQSVVIYLAAMRDVPAALYEAAALDGMGPVAKFRHVTLPAISPVILFSVITSIINSSQIFGAPYIMTQGGPDRATYVYSMYLYDAAFVYDALGMGYASAMAWVQLVVIVLLTVLTLVMSRSLVYYRAA